MAQRFSCALSRALVCTIIVICASFVGAAEANVKVDCSLGSIGAALAANAAASPLVLVVKGDCVENVVITRDDLTIKTNGVLPATVTAADNSLPTILLNGAHRIVINGVMENGISVSGGTFSIDASRGSTMTVKNCAVTGASNTGIIASYSSTASVDSCTVSGNAGGITAANTSSVAVTNSVISGNTGTGLTAIRSLRAKGGAG